jgi:hypothetical protein
MPEINPCKCGERGELMRWTDKGKDYVVVECHACANKGPRIPIKRFVSDADAYIEYEQGINDKAIAGWNAERKAGSINETKVNQNGLF